MSVYRCKGCGGINTIAEESLVPRTVIVYPTNTGADYGSDETYWEAETVMGYRCTEAGCNFETFSAARWNDDQSAASFDVLWNLDEIAETVDLAEL